MKIVLFRFFVVWIILHIILYFIEKYRYEYSNLSWHGFKNNEMLIITYFVLWTDMVCGIGTILIGLIYWISQPII